MGTLCERNITEVDVNITKERRRLILYNSRPILITTGIMMLLTRKIIFSRYMDKRVFIIITLPVIFNIIGNYISSKYVHYRINKTERNIIMMEEFFKSEYLVQIDNSDEFTLKTCYSAVKINLNIHEHEEYYELFAPKLLSRIIKNYGVRDATFTQHDD